MVRNFRHSDQKNSECAHYLRSESLYGYSQFFSQFQKSEKILLHYLLTHNSITKRYGKKLYFFHFTLKKTPLQVFSYKSKRDAMTQSCYIYLPHN